MCFFVGSFSAPSMSRSTSPCGWTPAGWRIFLGSPPEEVKHRLKEHAGSWPQGHPGGLRPRLSRCRKGLIWWGERVGWLRFPPPGTPHPWARFCEGSSCTVQGKRNELQLLGPAVSSALPLPTASQRPPKLPRLSKTCT